MNPINCRTTSNPSVDLTNIKLEGQKRLLKLLDKFEGTKTIVFDDRLIGPFEFVANANLLKQHEATRLFRLSDIKAAFLARTDYTLFFLRKDLHTARKVAEILQGADRITLEKTSLVMIPQRCASIEAILEQNKVEISKLNSIEELPIELFVMDTDILSMENEFAFRDLHLYDDHSIIHQIAEGLDKLQSIYGQIPKISGQGKGAKLVCDLLLKRRKLTARSSQSSSPQIHQLVLIDRRIDLITPFLTQLTYEGLLDEVFGINHGTITLQAEKFNQNDEQQNKDQERKEAEKKVRDTKRFELKSSEELFSRLRDCHINSIADALKQSAKNLQAEYDECNSEGKTIHEMGKIVKRLNHLKLAKKSQLNHVTIAELVNEQTLRAEFIIGLRIEHELLQEDRLNRIIPDIEMKLLRQEHPLHVMRLICLQSMVNNGLKQKISDFYKTEIFQNYGPQYLAFLLLLERANLLLSRERYYDLGSFSQLKNKFNLINDDVDECNPNHPSYVYGGYTPLSVAVAKILAQFTSGPQWRSQSDNLKLLPEPTVTHHNSGQLQQQQQQQLQAQQVLLGSTQTNTADLVSGGSLSESVGGSGIGVTSNGLASSAVAAASLLLSSAAGASAAAGSLMGHQRVRRNSATSSQSSSGEETKIVLVFFIGGCTFAEISALRFLTQQEDNSYEFLIGTTKIINGRTLLKSLWPYDNDPLKTN